MRPGAKLGTFVLMLAAAVGTGAAIGSVVGPLGQSGATPTAHDDQSVAERSGGAGDPTTGPDATPAGLSVIEDGYRLVPEDRLADPGRFGFTITGPDGAAVREFDVLHDRELHLIVASTDLQHYAHLHAERDTDGLWVADLPQLPAGAYRAFADFKPAGGHQHTLGIDLVAPGATGAPPALELRDRTVLDGFEITIDNTGTSRTTAEVVLTVRRHGKTVITEPYLGAAGHLVALRDGDLAYLHVHPLDEAPNGPVRFAVEVPTAGVYAMFFDFRIDGVVRNARFVLGLGEVSTVTSTTHSH